MTGGAAGRGGAAVWLNGRVVPRAEATVSVDDLGFRYGAGCMETMRLSPGGIFRLRRHLGRLRRGLAAMGVTAPDEETLRRAIAELARVNRPPGGGDLRVRLIVTPGAGGAGPALTVGGPPTVLVAADPLAPPAPSAATLAVSGVRVARWRPVDGAKHLNYLPMLLALAEARARGADEALLLTDDGRVVEGATSNLFVVRDGLVLTPPLADGPLAGITREAVIEAARELGCALHERTLHLAEVAAADEWFLTSAVVGVRPVAALLLPDAPDAPDAPQRRPAPGPVTARLAAAYAELTAREVPPPAP